MAIGGRATLLGPVLGSIAVSWAETSLSERFPSIWTYFLGALFIVVVAFLPNGLASLSLPKRRKEQTGSLIPATEVPVGER